MVGLSKSSRTELTESRRAFIWGLHIAGLTIRSISEQAGCPKSTVGRTILQVTENLANKADNPFRSKPRLGRPPKLDERAVRHLVRCATAERTDTLAALATPSKSGLQINRSTVRAILKANGKARRRARKKPYINPSNRMKRLVFKRRNKWTPWGLVCWSDEAYFEVGEDGRVIYVTRSPKEEYHPDCLQPTFKNGRTKVGVWGCFCGPNRGPIVILPQGTRLNRLEYTDQIFIPHFLPFYQKMRAQYGPGVQLQEDGASYHHGGFLSCVKRAAEVRILEWPAQSPDLSPIENIWHWMKLKIGAQRHCIKTVTQMAAKIQEVWEQVTPEVLMKMVNSMPKRMEMLARNKGGPIKY
jgi:transposase